MDIARLGVEVDTSSAVKGTGDLDRFGDQAQKTQGQVAKMGRGVGASFGAASKGLGNYSKSANVARLNTANLAAQGNDVIVMALAMQDPLQLALQQGTQVSQVLNQMGSRQDIIRGLGTAFMSLINPVSLATIGILAGGTALTQWILSADEAEAEAASLQDRLSELSKVQAQLNMELRELRLGVSPEELVLIDAIIEKRRELDGLERTRQNVGIGARGAAGRQNAQALGEAQAELQGLQQQLEALRAAQAEKEQLKTANRELADQERMIGQQLMDAVAQRAVATTEARAMIVELQAQAELQELVALFGADSREVAEARLVAERAVFEETLATKDVSAELKQELLEAWDNANGLAGTDMAGGVAAAAEEALILAERLQTSLQVAAAIARIGGARGASGPDQARAQVQDAFFLGQPGLNGVISVRNFPGRGRRRGGGRRRRSGGGGGGGGVSDADRAQLEMERERLRILESLKTAQDKYNEKVAQADRLLKAQVLTQGEYNAHVEQLQKELTEVQFEGFYQGIDNISDAIGRAIGFGEDLGESFKNILRQMAADIVSSNIRQLLTGLIPSGGGSSGGGFFGRFFAGLFDGGGHIPNGKFGIVGERGPELVSGPANVTSRAETARMMGGAQRLDVTVTMDPSTGQLGAFVRDAAGQVVAEQTPRIQAGAQQRTLKYMSETRGGWA